MARQILRSNEVLPSVCDALGLPHTRVYRLVLELTAGQPAIVGVEMRPDKDDADDVIGGFVTTVDRHLLVREAEERVSMAEPEGDE